MIKQGYKLSSNGTTPGVRNIWISCPTTPLNINNDGLITSFNNNLFDWFRFEANTSSFTSNWSYQAGGGAYNTTLEYTIYGLSEEKLQVLDALTDSRVSVIAVGIDNAYYLGSSSFNANASIENDITITFNSQHRDILSLVTPDLLNELGTPLEPVNLCINGLNICIDGENIQILN